MQAEHVVGPVLLVPGGEPHRHARGQAHQPGQHGEGAGELLAVAAPGAEQEVLQRVLVVAGPDVEAVGEPGAAQVVLQGPGLAVDGGLARDDAPGQARHPGADEREGQPQVTGVDVGARGRAGQGRGRQVGGLHGRAHVVGVAVDGRGRCDEAGRVPVEAHPPHAVDLLGPVRHREPDGGEHADGEALVHLVGAGRRRGHAGQTGTHAVVAPVGRPDGPVEGLERGQAPVGGLGAGHGEDLGVGQVSRQPGPDVDQGAHRGAVPGPGSAPMAQLDETGAPGAGNLGPEGDPGDDGHGPQEGAAPQQGGRAPPGSAGEPRSGAGPALGLVEGSTMTDLNKACA